MQETRVWSLVQGNLTCHGETKPVSHNYWTCALESSSRNYWAHTPTTTEACMPRACALQQEKLLQWEAGPLQRRVTPAVTKMKHSQK